MEYRQIDRDDVTAQLRVQQVQRSTAAAYEAKLNHEAVEKAAAIVDVPAGIRDQLRDAWAKAERLAERHQKRSPLSDEDRIGAQRDVLTKMIEHAEQQHLALTLDVEDAREDGETMLLARYEKQLALVETKLLLLHDEAKRLGVPEKAEPVPSDALGEMRAVVEEARKRRSKGKAE